ncbi:MAG: helix-turn-helix domain-containing protein [Planctomycetales bacterium]|nr:helix-turn-helix domain-containing protein [Planctomycetales bacterium]NIM09416.1 helix-turn-helix domain-containing protein [Planctomycetales bacterium]NIN08894.1 helix-turn-helix domain-containing protein [Planctomycetales bacterium]NIN78009.1 helix-turn-helix domain-containing protein [Planctomycetales bacterium]NIO35197.1 helix-turn-helix domain-containing protein [Planctomycetales bacterium]
MTIDHLLEELQLSVEQLAERSGLTCQRIAAIADGRWTPSPVERGKLAQAFGVAVEQISWGHTINPRNRRYHQFGLPEEF